MFRETLVGPEGIPVLTEGTFSWRLHAYQTCVYSPAGETGALDSRAIRARTDETAAALALEVIVGRIRAKTERRVGKAGMAVVAV